MSGVSAEVALRKALTVHLIWNNSSCTLKFPGGSSDAHEVGRVSFEIRVSRIKTSRDVGFLNLVRVVDGTLFDKSNQFHHLRNNGLFLFSHSTFLDNRIYFTTHAHRHLGVFDRSSCIYWDGQITRFGFLRCGRWPRSQKLYQISWNLQYKMLYSESEAPLFKQWIIRRLEHMYDLFIV